MALSRHAGRAAQKARFAVATIFLFFINACNNSALLLYQRGKTNAVRRPCQVANGKTKTNKIQIPL
jgi:hypothetical protein